MDDSEIGAQQQLARLRKLEHSSVHCTLFSYVRAGTESARAAKQKQLWLQAAAQLGQCLSSSLCKHWVYLQALLLVW
jgi:hypothetical protein